MTSLFFGRKLPTSGVNISFKFIGSEFHLDKFLKEIKEIGQTLYDCAANEHQKQHIEQDENQSEHRKKQSQPIHPTIMHSLMKAYIYYLRATTATEPTRAACYNHFKFPCILFARYGAENYR